jgi:hypothetical protein
MNAPHFPDLIRSTVHECAPDHSVHTISVGALRKAARDIAALYEALDELSGQHGSRAYLKAERALAQARSSK